ncbi:MAG: adenylate/guanylate cyclase domain-containing protein [Proteobacteria bacterium]|nr:adenylate/guanylate cyclase domain-containing protein [Pseudomonadota bacterium]
MNKKAYIKGDFGNVRTHIRREEVVGIFDLVGFTDIDSNDGLLAAVKSMETQISLVIGREDYAWDERERGGLALEAKQNEILLRSTGDGYFIAFSQADNDIEILNCLASIHKGISENVREVKLGINKGANYVVMDMVSRVNVIGWGINYAARALQFAQAGQIICTGYIAKPLIEEHGTIMKDAMKDLGERTIKNVKLNLFNYYKKEEFGAPPTDEQIKSC